MMRDSSFSVIIPVLNEERRIGPAVRAVHAYLTAHTQSFEIIVVEDGSRDRTVAVVRELAAELGRVTLLQLCERRGKGAAVRAGMLHASGDYLLFTDADQSTTIDHLGPMFERISASTCDVVIASRAAPGAVLARRQAWYREWLGRGFGIVLRALLLQGVRDTQCGFKLFTRDAARAVFSRTTCDNALFDMEVLLLCARLGFRVAEQPVRWVHDPDSRLVYTLGQAFGLLVELLRIRRQWSVRWPERIPLASPQAHAYQEADYLVREIDEYAAAKYRIVCSWLEERACRTLLNVGCGSGELSVLLARRGYRVDAIDISSVAVDLARRKAAEAGVSGRVRVMRADIFDFDAQVPYDAVVCLDVIEHLPNDSEALERLVGLVAVNGVLLLAVPALPRLYGFHDEQLGHYRRYSQPALEKLIARHFALERSRYFGFFLIPIALLYSKLLRRTYPVSKSSHALSLFVMRLEERVSFPLGTSLLAVARRIAA